MQLHLATLGIDSLLYSVLYGGYSFGLAVLACKSNAPLKFINLIILMAIGAQTLFLFCVPYKFQKFLHTLQHRFTIITFACTIPTKALCQLSNHI